MTDTPDLWQLALTDISRAQAETLAGALEANDPEVAGLDGGAPSNVALTVTTFEATPDGRLWTLEALFDGAPDGDWLGGILASVPGEFHPTLAPLQPKDWVVESRRDLPAVKAGRFHVHGTHLPRHPSPGAIDLTIEAGLAFGSGQHETTRGCLLAIDMLAKRRRCRNVLDLGTGSGVLALAAAKIWHHRVMAADIDPVAVAVARENAARHGEKHLAAVTAVGFGHRAIAAAAPFDLILANILARPLVGLAPALARHLAADGVVVLSGLLGKQEPQVRAAYRAQGLHLWRRIALGDWHTLVMTRRHLD